MLKKLEVTNLLAGRLDIDIDVIGHGVSTKALMAELNGKTVAHLQNGWIDNGYINLLGTDLSSAVFRLLNPFHKDTDRTGITCFVCGFKITNGIAESTALVLDTKQMSVIGEGQINLKNEKLNMALRPVPKQGLGTDLTGKIGLSIGELAKPFKLAGTLSRPSLAIDPALAAITLGKSIGGMVLFGPAGIAAALLEANSSSKDPCLTAIRDADKGVKMSPSGESVVGKTTEEAAKGIEDVFKSAGGTLKHLFKK